MDYNFQLESQVVTLYIEKPIKDTFGYGNKISDVRFYRSIKAMIFDVDYDRLQWKMPGIEVVEAKAIVFEEENLNLFLNSKSVLINGVEHYGWKDNYGNTRYKKIGEGLISAYIYRK